MLLLSSGEIGNLFPTAEKINAAWSVFPAAAAEMFD